MTEIISESSVEMTHPRSAIISMYSYYHSLIGIVFNIHAQSIHVHDSSLMPDETFGILFTRQ